MQAAFSIPALNTIAIPPTLTADGFCERIHPARSVNTLVSHPFDRTLFGALPIRHFGKRVDYARSNPPDWPVPCLADPCTCNRLGCPSADLHIQYSLQLQGQPNGSTKCDSAGNCGHVR